MQKIFFRNLAFLITVNLVVKPLWIFGIDRTVQNVVGTESYGLYFVLINFSLLTQILLDLGINNYNNRLLAQHEDQLQHYLSRLLSIKLFLALGYLLITITAAWLLGYSGYHLYLLLLICFNQVLSSLIVYIRTNINALHRFVVDSIFSVMDKALMIILCGAMLIIPRYQSVFTIEWFIYLQTASYAVTLFAALIYVLRISGTLQPHFSVAFTADILKKTFPYALLIALMILYTRIDAVMIEKLLPEDGKEEAGLYASAYRILDALNQFGYLFSVLLLPIFSRMLSRQQQVGMLVKTSFTAIFIFSLISALALSFFALPVMNLLYHEHTVPSAIVLQKLIYSLVGTSTVFIFGTLLTANGNLYLLSALSVIGVLANVVLNLLLIPSLKAEGASAAAMVTQLLVAALTIGMAWWIFRWKMNWGLLIRLVLFTVIATWIFFFFSRLSWHWLLSVLTACTISFIFSFLLGLLSAGRIRSLLSAS